MGPLTAGFAILGPNAPSTSACFADPEAAARKLMELAHAFEPVLDGAHFLDIGNGVMVTMRWGVPPPPRTGGRPARHQHSQHVIAALAHVAQAGEPLPGSG
jgi:hypothetical protein